MARSTRNSRRSGWVLVPETAPAWESRRHVAALEKAGLTAVRFELVTAAELADAVPPREELVTRLVDATDRLRRLPPVEGPFGLYGVGPAGEAAVAAAAELQETLAALVAVGVRSHVAGPLLPALESPTLLVAPKGRLPDYDHVEVWRRPTDVYAASEWMRRNLQEQAEDWIAEVTGRKRSGLRLVRRLIPVALLATSSLAALAPPSTAAVTASFSGGLLTISGNDANDDIVLSRTDSGAFRLNGDKIKNGPTVFNTNTIKIVTGDGTNTVEINETNGLFAPGATKEKTGKSEIEFSVTGGSGFDTKKLVGRPVDDKIDLGGGGFNINKDNDADIFGSSIDLVVVNSGGGDDKVSAAGNSVVGSAFPIQITVSGQSGQDVLRAGASFSTLDGGKNGDRLVGNDFGDFLLGGGGGDKLTGKAASDGLFGGGAVDLLIERRNIDFTLTDISLTDNNTEFDKMGSIERAHLTGGAGGNTIDAKDFTGPLIIRGLDGADVLTGGNRGDKLFGGLSKDQLFGRARNDLLNGNKGSDAGNGGSGTDDCISIENPTNCE
jgi:hypothetical protein